MCLPKRRRQLEALRVHPVQRLPDRVEGVDFHHHMDEPGSTFAHGGNDRQAVVPLVDAEEPDPHRAVLRGCRHPPRAAGEKAQHVGVEVEGGVGVGRGQDHMPQSLCAGDEPGAKGCYDGAVVEDGAVEHLDRGARRVAEGDRLFDAPGVGLFLRQRFDADTRGLQRLLNAKQRRPVADLPSDGDDFVGFAGDHDDPGGALVHAEVEGGRVRTGSLGESEHVEREGAPAVDVVGLDLDVTEALDVAHCGCSSVQSDHGPQWTLGLDAERAERGGVEGGAGHMDRVGQSGVRVAPVPLQRLVHPQGIAS